MSELNFEVTPVFLENLQSKKPIIINRGGTRSSKTYSLSQLFILKLISEPHKKLLISRKTFPALRVSAMYDVLSLLREYGIYNPAHHNKTEHTYTYPKTGSVLYFVSIDDAQKIRGPEWNYAWFNEANEMVYEDFKQVYMRLSGKSDDGKLNQFYLDFNPSDVYTWINQEIELKRDTAEYDLIHSTYHDNPFIDAETIRRIEWLEDNDPNFWTIYGLGEYGRIGGQVFTDWDTVESFPDPRRQHPKWTIYGLDFGYSNDPTALVKIGYLAGELYWQQLIYERQLTNTDISQRLHDLSVTGDDIIVADSAEPKSIEELKRLGWAVVPAQKGADSVRNGLDIMRRYTHHLTTESADLIKEFQSYKWQEDPKHQDEYLNQPVDFMNHGIDAGRYAIIYQLQQHKQFWVV